jgi:TatD DNase family protein
VADLVDTHCHIQSAGLETGEATTRKLWAKDPSLTGDTLAKTAAAAGVIRLICVGCDLEDSRLAVEFVQKQAHCWASIGIHPHEAKHFFGRDASEQVASFASLVARPKVVAIGECGLDYYYEHSPRAVQLKALEFQLGLALAAGLPLIFHVRQAFDDFWSVFDSYKGVSGVLHSYTDSATNLDKALARGLYLGVNGIATFTKDSEQLKVYQAIPLDNLLLETDAPFLAPAPHRGSVNQPKNISAIADFLAKLRGDDPNELATTTTDNARQLFGI